MSREIKKRKRILVGLCFIFLILSCFILSRAKQLSLSFREDKLAEPIQEKTQEEKFLEKIRLGLADPELTLVGEPEITASSLVATFSGGLVVIFSTKREPQAQADSLQFIITRAKIEGRSPKRIDLRFNKPVVTF